MAIETRTDDLNSGGTAVLTCTRAGDGRAQIDIVVKDALGVQTELIVSPSFRDSMNVLFSDIRWPYYALRSRGIRSTRR